MLSNFISSPGPEIAEKLATKSADSIKIEERADDIKLYQLYKVPEIAKKSAKNY